MRDMYRFWEQGVLIVHVDERGDFTIVPCRIYMVNGQYSTVYMDKVYTETGTETPSLKVFLNTDLHCSDYDPAVLALQNDFVQDFKPDVYVNMGDMQNNRAFNHHEIDKGVRIDCDSVQEDAPVFYLLRRMAEWAPMRYLMYGNHERFVKDFAKRMPQYATMFKGSLRSALNESNYVLYDHRDVLSIGDMRCIHGDAYLFGQTGTLLEKVARTFGSCTAIGHLHSTTIRFGCYMLGMSGKLLQGYNEEASSWNLGFGTCVQYGGQAWITPWSITSGKVITRGRTYTGAGRKEWVVPEFQYRVVYDFQPSGV